MSLSFFTVKDAADLKRCDPVMKELRANLNCKSLRLCTGIENDRGVKFYEKNNWVKRAYAFTKKIG